MQSPPSNGDPKSVFYDISGFSSDVPIPVPSSTDAALHLTNHTKQLTTMPPIMKLPKQYTTVVVDASCSNIRTIEGSVWECGFLYGSSGLTALDLSGFSGVTTVENSFLSDCSGLTTIDLSPLSGVTTVGGGFLSCCSGLMMIDLSPLSGVTTVGDSFLANCSGLTTIDLSPLSGVTTVGGGFLSCCSGLTTIDLSPLSGVTTVGDSFLAGCSDLTTIDLTPLHRFTEVGDWFLARCSGLTTIDLSPLSGVTTIGNWLLYGCSCVVLAKKSGLLSVETSLRGSTSVHVTVLPDNVLETTSFFKTLGGGGQGTVSLFVSDESNFAVKSVPCTANSRALRHEYEKLVRLNHPNIVRVMEYVENFSLPGTREPHDCIVMEYAELGSISSLVVRDGSQKVTTMFPEFDRWLDVALQTLTGLQALHGNSMHHNDLKPANILMTREGGKVVYKLADLGFGEVFEEGHSTKVLAGCPGTRGYMAPESIEENKFSRASDVYSWACTMGYVATGKAPRSYDPDRPNDPRGFTVNELMKDGTPLPHDVAEELLCCFTYNKARRPTVEELMGCLMNHEAHLQRSTV